MSKIVSKRWQELEIIIERNVKDVCESCMSDDRVDSFKVTTGVRKVITTSLCRACQEMLMLKLLDNIGIVGDK